MRAVAVASTILCMLLPTGQAQSWNHKGHMAVAYIAYQQLTEQERAKVFRLLRAHPDFPAISKLAGSPRRSMYRMLVFVQAARWPDLIRDDPRFYDETDPHALATKRLPNFPDMKKHKPWHFKDQGFTTDGTAFGNPDRINAQTAIHAFRQSIGKSELDVAQKAYFFAWLEHLVGDVHQPLHCATRFSQDHPRGDRGGNQFSIAPYQILEVSQALDNLHSFWDDVLGADTRLAAVRVLAGDAEASNPPEDTGELDEAVWIKESFDYAQSVAYKPLDNSQSGTPSITKSYFDTARALALERVKLAGYRLALAIKQDLK